MTAYYIGQHQIEDESAFAQYLEKTLPFIAKHGGRAVTRSTMIAIEGP